MEQERRGREEGVEERQVRLGTEEMRKERKEILKR